MGMGDGDGAATTAAAVGVGTGAGSGSESPHEVNTTAKNTEIATAVSDSFPRQRKLGRQRRNGNTTPIMVDSLWVG